MDLKRAMLLRLARRNTELYPGDPVKREKVYDKYKVDQKCLGSLRVLNVDVMFKMVYRCRFCNCRGYVSLFIL